jgi:hypothetical protein
MLTQQIEHTSLPRSVDCSLPGRGGVNLDFLLSSLRDSQGTSIGLVLVVIDRTELKRAQAQASTIRRVFERYVHPNVVQQLIKDPRTLHLDGQTREVSVLFADIRGYTHLHESIAPEDMMQIINHYLSGPALRKRLRSRKGDKCGTVFA